MNYCLHIIGYKQDERAGLWRYV